MTHGVDYSGFSPVMAHARDVLKRAHLMVFSRTITSPEREIASDLHRSRWTGPDMPPYVHDELGIRLGRLATCAAMIRLAMRAGGWDRDAALNVDEDSTVGLPQILAACLMPAEILEEWNRVYNKAIREIDFADRNRLGKADEWMVNAVPDLNDRLAEAERMFGHPGSLDHELYAIVVGEPDWM